MDNTISIALLAVLVVLVVGYFALFAYALWKLSRIYFKIASFLTPESDDKPSQFALVADAIAQSFARSAVAQAKTTFMGVQSGSNRGEQGVMADIAQDSLASKAPLVAGILSQFPSLQKTLRKNPMLIDFALSKLAGAGARASSTPGNGDKPRFNL